MTIKEVAQLSGVSVRTLHHYDQMGLLCPQRTEQNGYRHYTEADLDTLQQILLWRACGYPLAHIASLLADPGLDRLAALERQEAHLAAEMQRLSTMLETLRTTRQYYKGERTMMQQEKFKGFDFTTPNPYEAEAREKWGDASVDASNQAVAALDEDGKMQLTNEMNALFARLATLRDTDPASDEAQLAMQEYYTFLRRFHPFTPQQFAGLGQMYLLDERFTNNIDAFGPGLASFLEKAMAVFSQEQEN